MTQDSPFLNCIATIATAPDDVERLRKIEEFARKLDAEKKEAENENT